MGTGQAALVAQEVRQFVSSMKVRQHHATTAATTATTAATATARNLEAGQTEHTHSDSDSNSRGSYDTSEQPT